MIVGVRQGLKKVREWHSRDGIMRGLHDALQVRRRVKLSMLKSRENVQYVEVVKMSPKFT